MTFLRCGGILLSSYCLSDKRRITFLNVYGPCIERKLFWEKVDARVLLAQGDLIIAGDLNFTTNAKEVWGATTLLDPFSKKCFF